MERGGERGEHATGGARTAWRACVAVALLALLPSLGTIGAPWIADDAAILAKVAEDGPWADWTRSQYGLHVVRFWRPLVSTSWALQEAASGIDPVPLRLFNLALHLGVALLAFGCARRLGAYPGGALLAGAWIALFPEQGGNVTWLAGRTDLLCAFFLLASVWTALGKRPFLGAPLAFLACASKEFGFLAPLWALAFARERRDAWKESLHRAAPAVLGAGVAFLWRSRALGGIEGGYPAELPALGPGVLAAARAVVASAWPSLLMAVALVGAGFSGRKADRRAISAAALAAGLALVPLYRLLADGYLEPTNRRLFYVAECALALLVALAWSCHAARPRRMRAGVGLVLALLGARGWLAYMDTHEWAAAASFGEQQVEAARYMVGGAEPSAAPVLFEGFEPARGGAYCLGFGLAARFRAPFPETPRPVWPWRLVFAQASERERSALVDPHPGPKGVGSFAVLPDPLWPLDDAPLRPPLSVLAEDGAPALSARFDERAVLAELDRSPRFALTGRPLAGLEALLYTELGYEPFPLGALGADGAASFTLMQLLASANGAAAAAQCLAQAADLGAERAYLELRAVGAGGAVLAASRWIELTWPPELLERAFSGG